MMDNPTPHTILILDDEETIRIVLAAELREKGYSAFALEDKVKGYEWVLANRPDLIISDIKSPGMDGFELLRHLKANPFTAKVPFLFVTGYSSLAVAIESKKLGAVDFITKPYDLPDLFSVIERIFREEYSTPIYPDVPSQPALFDQGNIRHAPWRESLRLLAQSLTRSGARISVLPGATPWVADIVADHRRVLTIFRLLRGTTFSGMGAKEVLEFKRVLDEHGLDQGTLCSLSPVDPLAMTMGELLRVRVLPLEETRSFLAPADDAATECSQRILPESRTITEEQVSFARFARSLSEEIRGLDGNVLHAPPAVGLPLRGTRMEAIRLIVLQDHRMRFETPEGVTVGILGEDHLWEAITLLWTTGEFKPFNASFNDEVRVCLFVLLCSFIPFAARGMDVTFPGRRSETDTDCGE
jgi:DNA-binding response OmpR family regulator